MDIPGLGVTEGEWDLRGHFAPYIGNVDLKGLSVLDIGAASGFLSFSAEEAGASEVVSFDIDAGDHQTLLPFKDSLYYRDHAAWAKERTALFERWKNGYWLAHQALKSQAQAVYGDVYNLPQELGTFDVVLFCAVLDHLADPIRALASVARHAADRLVLGVVLAEGVEPIAIFWGRSDQPEQDASFWAYSLKVYQEVLAMLGFSVESVLTSAFLHSKTGNWHPRTAIVTRRDR